MKIKRLRKKLQNKKWVFRKYNELTKREDFIDFLEWHEFKPFFVGKERAEFNKIKYRDYIKRTERQIQFIKRIYKQLNENKNDERSFES